MSSRLERVLLALAATRRPLALAEIAEAAMLARQATRLAAAALVRAGLAARAKQGMYRATAAGRSAAHGRRPGEAEPIAGKAWRALRRVRKATVAEIVALAEVGDGGARARATVRDCLAAWMRAGYVARVGGRSGARGNGLGPGAATYVLARDTGPAAPARLARGAALLDLNTGEVHPVKAPADA